MTDPFLRELQRAARRGVRVRIVTPEMQNFPLVRQALAHAAERSPLELRLYPGRMTHMKALLIDDQCLVLGSANFDVWSDRSPCSRLSAPGRGAGPASAFLSPRRFRRPPGTGRPRRRTAR